MYVKIETTRLDCFRNNKKQIRVEIYQGIVDRVEIGESRGYKVSRCHRRSLVDLKIIEKDIWMQWCWFKDIVSLLYF